MIQQGYNHLMEEQYSEAIDVFSACIAVNPEEISALRGRAIARFQMKEWVSAEGDFFKAMSLDDKEPEHSLGYAMSLAMQLKIYPAIAQLEALLQSRPDFVRAYIQLGLLQLRIGAIAKGKELFEEALKHAPKKEERKFIESTLSEQKKLDQKRYYRPDFHALNQKKKSTPPQ